ncbi:Helix-turn-helix domain containing protein [uncultured Caudovirales phage]|uniref:Helix-turn-helix domain containing protein n=1 Tax=uncultured Caudovirales phage TaxID=2100421 RepID=A0A6J5NPX7_9CAUD|nr:Helix-turn-helix domain containing protein [uncultured Caudovirales phage]
MIESKYKIPEQIKLKTVKNEDQRRFCVVPLKAFLNRKVSGENLRVLAILASYCNRGGYSFVSLKTIAKNLGCSPQNILKHLNKLEAQGIIETKSNYFPMLKGNTRRIIYDEKIKDDDLKEHQFTNADISEILKINKVINQLEDTNEPLKVNQSAIQEDDDLTSLFNTITRESDLLEAERLLSQGLTPKEVIARMALGS